MIVYFQKMLFLFFILRILFLYSSIYATKIHNQIENSSKMNKKIGISLGCSYKNIISEKKLDEENSINKLNDKIELKKNVIFENENTLNFREETLDLCIKKSRITDKISKPTSFEATDYSLLSSNPFFSASFLKKNISEGMSVIKYENIVQNNIFVPSKSGKDHYVCSQKKLQQNFSIDQESYVKNNGQIIKDSENCSSETGTDAKYVRDDENTDFNLDMEFLPASIRLLEKKRIYYTYKKNIRKIILHENIQFIELICGFFSQKLYLIFKLDTLKEKDDMQYVISLKKQIENEIERTKNELCRRGPRVYSKECSDKIKFIEKEKNFCSFCKEFQKYEPNLAKINDLCSSISRNGFSGLFDFFNDLLKISSKIFDNFSFPESLFQINFCHSARIILEETYNFIENHQLRTAKEIKIAYLHREYHRFIENCIPTKVQLLPEFYSIIFSFLNLSSKTILHYNENFTISFYSLHFLNNFIEHLDNEYKTTFGEIEKLTQQQRFFSSFTSFFLRISFIEPLVSTFYKHKQAQMKYHFLVLNIFNDELNFFLDNGKYSNLKTKTNEFLSRVLLYDKNVPFKNFFSDQEFFESELKLKNFNKYSVFIKFASLFDNANNPLPRSDSCS